MVVAQRAALPVKDYARRRKRWRTINSGKGLQWHDYVAMMGIGVSLEGVIPNGMAGGGVSKEASLGSSLMMTLTRAAVPVEGGQTIRKHSRSPATR